MFSMVLDIKDDRDFSFRFILETITRGLNVRVFILFKLIRCFISYQRFWDSLYIFKKEMVSLNNIHSCIFECALIKS